jgi:hypothetical protein
MLLLKTAKRNVKLVEQFSLQAFSETDKVIIVISAS